MANVPISNLTTTWNNVATTFTGIKLNVTDTASAAASLLMDLQVGGASRFSVGKDGAVSIYPSVNAQTLLTTRFGFCYFGGGSIGDTSQSAFTLDSSNTQFKGRSSALIGWTNSGTNGNATLDTILARDAANTLAQRNGVNAQTSRLYGTYTDGSNYRRLTKTMSTGGVAEIKPEGAGTGASGNVLHISGLPTSNPGPGILWNNLGIVNVGT